MPDMERLSDQLRIDMAKHERKYKSKSADFWEGYIKGKSKARWEVLIISSIIYFGITAIGYYYT